MYHCTEYFHKLAQEDSDVAYQWGKVLDSNGNELFDDDDVTVIKDLKVKDSSMIVKRGTRVRGIRLSEDARLMFRGVWMDKQSLFSPNF